MLILFLNDSWNMSNSVNKPFYCIGNSFKTINVSQLFSNFFLGKYYKDMNFISY